MTLSKVSPARIEAAWNKIKMDVDTLLARSEREDGYAVQPGSPMAGDDRHGAPHLVSQAGVTSISAAVDNLHAVCTLLGTGILHIWAPATLLRGSLETASAAIWIMSPSSRNERISRMLRWSVADIKDSNRAATGAQVPMSTPLQDRLDKVELVAQKRGLDFKTIKGGYKSSEAAAAAESFLNLPIGVVLPWQLCSGFAHWRPWVQHAFGELQKRASAAPGVTAVKIETDLGRLLYLAIAAVSTTKAAVQLFDQRASR